MRLGCGQVPLPKLAVKTATCAIRNLPLPPVIGEKCAPHNSKGNPILRQFARSHNTTLNSSAVKKLISPTISASQSSSESNRSFNTSSVIVAK